MRSGVFIVAATGRRVCNNIMVKVNVISSVRGAGGWGWMNYELIARARRYLRR